MIKKLFLYLATAGFLAGCTDLNVDVKSELTPDNFPVTEEQFVTASGSIYTSFASGYGTNYWNQTELSTDAAVLTANGGNWFDGGRYMELHYHSWTKNSDIPRSTWSWLYRTVNTCNNVYELLMKAPESEARNTSIAELRVMRALCYYLLIDNFGDVPLVKVFGDAVKTRNPRKEVFEYIESETLESLRYLKPENDISVYGRPNQMTAYALLAKLYLNAGVYTGQAMNDKALEMCDKVIEFEDGGAVGLHADYIKMFDYDNGPHIKEFIFAIPYDENNLSGFIPSRYWYSIYHPYFWGLSFTTSSCTRVLPQYYDLFAEDTDDIREKTWLKEKQYLKNGEPMIYPATKVQIDNRYTGPDKDETVLFHITHTKELEFRSIPNFDMGDDLIGRLAGYRSNKYNPSTTQLSRDQSNDLPVFRYADILLMKAEAILRGATPTKGHTALSLVNRVRERSHAAKWSGVDMDKLLEERAREMCYECWRRNDLIRFDKFEDSWLLKTDTDKNHRLFPVPQSEIDSNKQLTQNPGY
ncbi:MAG: RagB/SusD family nutrient uptake outer membrane protein [Tannerellaceae bacterium]|jgi:hypothetical protein|nr:RagB/SusD family nutrient uptake outer membrane protein [Tannerellaceae bacterium]